MFSCITLIFSVQATVQNTLPSPYPVNAASNSHSELQGPQPASYAGTLRNVRISAEFAVANLGLLPSGVPPYYTDPLSGGAYFIEAGGEYKYDLTAGKGKIWHVSPYAGTQVSYYQQPGYAAMSKT